jgi:hypothetical protein
MAETELKQELREDPVGVSEGAVPDTAESGGGAEQRNEERYPVLGDAEVFVIGGMSMFRGRVLNISSSGCYVQTIAWAKLPPETTVEVLLTLQGQAVRALAEARYSASRVGLGLRFLSMEEPTRLRLEGLLASLRRSLAERGEEMPEDPGDLEATPGAEAVVDPQEAAGVGGASGTSETSETADLGKTVEVG